MLKFVHCADLHLDSPLRGLSRYPGAPVDLVRAATRDAFSNLVDFCIQEDVSFVVIAGDIYDGNWRDFNTGIYFSAQLGTGLKVGKGQFHQYIGAAHLDRFTGIPAFIGSRKIF